MTTARDEAGGPCELCGCPHSTPRRAAEAYTYARCDRCNSERQTRTVPSTFEAEQRRYYAEDSLCGSPLLQALARRRALVRLRHLRRHMSRGTLIEVGPGSGDVLSAAQSAGFNVEAVEHSPVLAHLVFERTGATVHVGAFEELLLPRRRYDAWLSYHVIEHVADPIRHLQKGLEVVKPGGYAFIATPNVGSWEQSVAAGWSPNYSSAHVRLFSADGMRIALDRTGWELIELRGLATDDGWPRILTGWLRRLRPHADAESRRGNAVRATPPRLGRVLLGLFRFAAWPLLTAQTILDAGNELFVVARRPAADRSEVGRVDTTPARCTA